MTLDAGAVERLYRSHGHVVMRRARTLLGSEDDAREVLQDVFADLLHAPGAVKVPGSALAWLYQATTHRCLNQLRNRRTGLRLLDRHVAPGQATTEGPRGEALAAVRQLLGRLPAELAEVVVYHHLDGMTQEEISLLVGCSRRQVGYLLERAQASLQSEERTA
ncbi:MAG TPA: sigma-70 family RNA polymerase sigma factor [Myxococcaceae bacterium]|nr:sigma-70 family RNA polymerase sigma factor [Myxococcaceae bacterium]